MLTRLNFNTVLTTCFRQSKNKLQPVIIVIAGAIVSMILFTTGTKAQEGNRKGFKDADCCTPTCPKWVIMDSTGWGHCRNCRLMCPNCRKELGDLNKAWEGLRGRNRGLSEAYKALESDYKKYNQQRDDARNRAWGVKEGSDWGSLDGSVQNFISAGAGVISNATGYGTVADGYKHVLNGISLYQGGLNPQGSHSSKEVADAMANWGGAASDLFTSEFLKQKMMEEIIDQAINTMFWEGRNGIPLDKVVNNFNRNCDLIPNTPIKFQHVSKGAEALGFATDLWGFYWATAALAKDLTDYLENLRDANAAKKELDKISEQIAKNADMMACIKETLDSLKSGGIVDSRVPGPSIYYAQQMIITAVAPKIFRAISNIPSPVENEVPIPKPLFDSMQLNEYEIKSALLKLKQLNILQEQMVNHIEKKVVPPLIPWMTRRWNELKPLLLLQMLQRVKPPLQVLASDCERLKNLVQSINSNLQLSIIPSGNGPTIVFGSPDMINPGEQWSAAPDEKLKGEQGRLVMNFPAGVEWDIGLYTQADNKFISSFSSLSTARSYNLSPGEYKLSLSRVPVPHVFIQKGQATKVRAGYLNITFKEGWQLYDASKKVYYNSHANPKKIALPVGAYQLKLGERYYPLVIKEGETQEY